MLDLFLALSFFVGATLGQGMPTISVKGAKLFTSDGAQFFIKGIAYQGNEDDTLTDPAQCERDARLMSTLGTNSIRVYHVEPQNNHDGCMSAFADQGIYVWLDLDNPDTYILPLGSDVPRWTENQLKAYTAIMDEFQGYDNIAGFFLGNEMLTTGADSVAAPFLKAAARDLKAYRDKQGYRDIPIGYSAADIPALRPNLQNYLACGSDASENVDFFSLNAYEWCGISSYETSGYSMLEQNATGYDIPIFFSETGCNVPPRTFDDQAAILGPLMDETWSGAIIYQWIEKSNDFGIISYGGKNAITGNPTPIQPDFNNLKSQWATLNPVGVAEAAYKPSFKPPPCPPYTKGGWEVRGDAPLPSLGERGKPIQESTTVNALKSATKSAINGGSAETATATKTPNSASSIGRSSMPGLVPGLHNWLGGVAIVIGGLALLL